MELPLENLTKAKLWTFVEMTTGPFHLRDIYSHFDAQSERSKAHIRVTLSRFCAEGILKTLDGKDGIYRRVDSALKTFDWESVDETLSYDLKLPFGLHTLAVTEPSDVVMVAGEKNAGKTAFMMNCVKENMYDRPVVFFNSETSPRRVKSRMYGIAPELRGRKAPFFVFWERENFGDKIWGLKAEGRRLGVAELERRDKFIVIDYVLLHENPYQVSRHIDDILAAIEDGVAIIALQKPKRRTQSQQPNKNINDDYGYGGAYSAFRTSLYITIFPNRLKIVHCKEPRNPRIHPENKQWTFDMDDTGTVFANIKEYKGEPI